MNKFYKKAKDKIKNYNIFYILLKTIRDYIFYFINKISNYRLEKIIFYKKVGYKLNLKNPRSFNEKIIWKKINDRNPLLPITTDKYKVRSYIKKVLGEKKAEEILIPLLYVTDKPENIPFERLPSAFIIKPNHFSGSNIIVKNDDFNKKEIIVTCRRWLKTFYGMDMLEWAYQSIKRKIIIEKLLFDDDGMIPKDFKFNIFHGKCKLIFVEFDRMGNLSQSYFDENWNFLPVKKTIRPQGPKIRKPKNYEIMLELAEKIAKDFDYVRVDLYNINGKIYFGELTHYSASGRGKLEPSFFDFKLGKYWKIKPEYWKNK